MRLKMTESCYGCVGNVTSIKDPRGKTTLFTVNELNQVVQIVSPPVTLHNNTTTTYRTGMGYDANDNVEVVKVENRDENGAVQTTHPWIETRYTYTVQDKVATIVEQLGPDPQQPATILTRTTSFEYNKEDQLYRVTKPEGNVVTYEYDDRGLLSKTTGDPNLGQPNPIAATVDRSYDANGNLIAIANPNLHLTRFEYDLYDRLKLVTDALGNTSDRAYDKNSNVSWVEAKASGGALLARTKWAYDELNRAYEVQRWVSGDVQTGIYVKSTTLFDANSLPRKLTDANGKTVEFAYDRANRLTGTTDAVGNKVNLVYDGNSNVTQRTDTEVTPGGSETFVWKRELDEVNRVKKSWDQGPDRQDANDDLYSYFRYDSRSNLTRLIDAKGSTAVFTYDALSRRTQVQQDANGLNITSQYVYDKNSRLTDYYAKRKNTDAAADWHRTHYDYDRLDRATDTDYGDGKTSALVLDAVGNVLQRTDPNGSVSNRTYDLLERLDTVSIARGNGVLGTLRRDYDYDGLSRLVRVTDDNGDALGTADDTEVSYPSYDGLSRVLTETQKYGSSALPTVNKSVTYSFDSGEATPDRLNLNRLSYPDSTVLRYGRDGLDRIENVYVGNNTTNRLARFSYGGRGRTLSRTYATGTGAPQDLSTLTVAYDAIKRVRTYTNKFSNQSDIASFSYGYDKAHNRVYAKHLHAGNTGEVYLYDTAYRVTNAYYGVSAGGMSVVESAVAAGNAPSVSQGDSTRSVSYALDLLGNRNTVTDAGATQSYASNPGNDYRMNRYSAVGGVTRLHDANGNLTDDGVNLYAYDAYNRLVQVKRRVGGLLLAEYKYDAFSRRVRKTVTNSGTLNGVTRYVYDGSMVIEEYAVTNPGAGETLTQTARYLNGRYIDERLVVERADVGDVNANANTTEFQRFYYHTDVLGSVRAVTWLNGTTEKLVERVDYDIYGKATFKNWGPDRVFGNGDDVTSTRSLVGNPYLFTGRELDSETGLYYYRLRYYDPATGRFISQDPSGYSDGPNLYAYAMNSPLNFVDPMGLMSSLWNRDWGVIDHVIDVTASFAEGMADQITGGRVSKTNQWWSKEILGQELNYRQSKMAKKAGKWAGVAWQIAFALAGGGGMANLQKLAKTNAYAKRIYQAILLGNAGYGGAQIGTGVDMVSQGKTVSGTKMIAAGVLTLLLAIAAAEQLNSQEGGGSGGGSGGTEAGGNGGNCPKYVYRGGSASPANMTPRPPVPGVTEGDPEGLSTFDNIESATKPGQNYQVIDTDKLPEGGLVAVPDSPDGHVSIRPGTEMTPDVAQQIEDWQDTRPDALQNPEAPANNSLTQTVINAVVGSGKRPK